MAGNKIGIVLALDGEKEFNQALANINKTLQVTKSESEKVSAEYEGQKNTIEALTAKHEVLSRKLVEQKEKQNVAQRGLDNANKTYNAARGRLNELERALEDTKKALENSGTSSEELSKQLKDQTKEVDLLSGSLKTAKEKYKEMQASGTASKTALKDQAASVNELSKALKEAKDKQKGLSDRVKPVNDYTKAIDRQKGEIGRCENKIKTWQQKLNTAQREVIETNRAVNENAAYMREAQEATDGCAKSIDEFGKAVSGSDMSLSVKDGFLAGIGESLSTGAIDLVKAGVDAVKESMYDLSSASAHLAASTGLSESEAKRYQDVMKQIKGENFGESYEDVADAMGTVIKSMGKLSDVELKDVTENAMTLRDTFDMDYQESIRAVKMLMDQFGISSEEAFNLIVQGAQQGLDKNGDLLDTINEYSVHYAQMGVSADGFFNSLKNGTDAGTFSVDKLGDAYKEFGVRVKDSATSTDEAYEKLGLNGEEMRSQFAQGGESAQAATETVLAALVSMDDKVAQNEIGVALFGTMWEDLGEKGITALTNLNGSISSSKEAMESLKEVQYSDLESAVSGLGTAFQNNVITPIGEFVAPGVTSLFEGATEALNTLGGNVETEKTVLDNFIADIAASNDEVQRSLESARGIMDNAEAEGAKLDAYKQLFLDLNNVTDKTEFQKYQLRTAVAELSNTVPGLAEAFDGETASLSLTNDELERMFDNAKDIAMQDAYLAAQEESMQALAMATLNRVKAENALEEAEKARRHTDTADKDATMAVNARIEEAEKELAEMQQAEREAKKLTRENEEALKSIGVTLGDTAEATNDFSGATQGSTEAADDNKDAIEEAAKAAKVNAETQKEAAKSILDTYNGYVDEIKADLQNKISLFDKFDAGTDMTAEEIKENVRSQKEGLLKMNEDMKYVIEQMGDDLDADYLEYLKSLGTDGASLWSHYADTIRNQGEEGKQILIDTGKDYADAMDLTEEMAEARAANKLAYEAMTGDLGSSDADFSALEDAVEAAATSAAGKWKELPKETKKELDTVVQTAKECGIKIPEGLTEGIASGEVSAEDAIKQLNGSLRGSFDGLAEVAKKVGIGDDILKGLSDGIDAGGEEAAAAYDRLIDLIAEKSPELQEAMAGGDNTGEFEENVKATTEDAAGVIPDAAPIFEEKTEVLVDAMASTMKEGAEKVKTSAEDVAKAGAEAIEGQAEAYTKAGETLGGAFSDGISSKKKSAETAGEELGTEVNTGAGKADLKTAGATQAGEYASGIRSKKQSASDAGGEVAGSAKTGAENVTGFHTAGFNMASGIAQGITDGSPIVEDAAKNVVKAAKDAANKEADSHSPSRVFQKQVGFYMSAGMAKGILDGQKDVAEASRKTAFAALREAKETLGIHSPSKKFKEDVGKQVAKGFAFGIKDSSSLAGKEAEKMSNQVYKKSTAWLTKYKKTHKTSLDDEQYYWQQIAKHTKKGTDAHNKALAKMMTASVSKKNDSGKKKDTETYYSEIYSESQKYLQNQQILNDWSLKSQLSYWTQVRGQLKKGTQAWYNATKEIKNLQKEIDEEQKEAEKKRQEEAKQKTQTHANVQRELLSKYKVYNDVSAKAEMQYWDIARKQFKEGTDERIAADQSYLEAKEEYYGQQKELDEEYAENKKELDEELAESIADLQEKYDDAVKSRKQEILSSMSLFEAWDAEGYKKEDLTKNLKTQVEGLKFWEKQIEELSKKGLTAELMDELREMGPEASASLWSLNQMTEEELKAYNDLWTEKNALAEKQAIEENKKLLKETNDAIAKARKDTQNEMASIESEYRKAVADLNKGLSDGLKGLVEQAGKIGEEIVSKLVNAIKDGATAEQTRKILADAGVTAPSGSGGNAASQPAQQKTSSGASEKKTETTTASSKKKDAILEIINSGSAHVKKLSAEEKKKHHELWKYLVEQYGREPTYAIYKKLADAIGVKTDSKATDKQKDAILKALKKKGYARGVLNLKQDEWAWTQEGGMELITRPDGGVWTPLQKGSSVLRADISENLMEWGERSPQEYLSEIQERMSRQQQALAEQASTLNYSGIAALNRMTENYRPQAPVVNVDNSSVAAALQQVIAGLPEMLAEALSGMQMVTDTGVLAGQMQPLISQESAAVTVRRNRGRI